jgi:hypothetical protein
MNIGINLREMGEELKKKEGKRIIHVMVPCH